MKAIEPIDLKWLPANRAAEALIRVAKLQEQGIPCCLGIVVAGGTAEIAAGTRVVLPLTADPSDTSPDIRQLLERAQRLRSAPIGQIVLLELPDARAEIYLDPVVPPSHAVILGAGHIGAYTARLAAFAGFEVTVIDDRSEFAHPSRVPDAHHVLAGPFVDLIADLPSNARTYWVIATRGHQSDEVCLRACLRRPGAYIGLLSSRQKAQRLLDHMEQEGCAPELVRSVRAPIGLPIGSITPEEIAVSIVAQLIAVRNERERPE